MQGKVIGRLYPPEGMPETGKRIYEIRLQDGQRALLKVALDSHAALRLKNEYQALEAVRGCDGYPEALWLHTIRSSFDRELKAGVPALCMTPLPGRSMATVMEQNATRKIRLTSSQGLHFAEGALRTLGNLHAAGWIHRDPNPSNILVDSSWNAAFVDLELAAPVSELDMNIGAQWGVANSYQPPESTSSRLRWGRYSDIYTLAAVTAQACFGTHEAQDIRNIDTPFGRWLACCLHPSPFHRPQTCAEALTLLNPAKRSHSLVHVLHRLLPHF